MSAAPGPIPLALTAAGYLVIPAPAARALFPSDTLVPLVRDGVLWLLPTRGPGAGGLLLKQRNAAGDRAVLLAEVLDAHVPARADDRTNQPPPSRALAGMWDDRQGALLVPLDRPGVPAGR